MTCPKCTSTIDHALMFTEWRQKITLDDIGIIVDYGRAEQTEREPLIIECPVCGADLSDALAAVNSAD